MEREYNESYENKFCGGVIMKEAVKNRLMLGVGIVIGLTLVDVIKEGKFDFKELLLRIVVIAIVFVIFAFIESRRKTER